MSVKNSFYTVVVIYSRKKPTKRAVLSGALLMAYRDFSEITQRYSIKLVRCDIDEYDTERKLFCTGKSFNNGRWQKEKDIVPNLVFDRVLEHDKYRERKTAIASNFIFLNDLRLTNTLSDKYTTYRLLPKAVKRYSLVNDQEQLRGALSAIKGVRVVVKPVSGSGGAGIVISTKKQALAATHLFPVVVQEFIDSSKGIAGATPSYHDLRLVFVGKQVVQSYIRTPKMGSFLANVARGGTEKYLSSIPQRRMLLPIMDYVLGKLESFQPATFSVDLMIDGTGHPWVIELNSMPGLYVGDKKDRPYMEKYMHALCGLFLATIKKAAAEKKIRL